VKNVDFSRNGKIVSGIIIFVAGLNVGTGKMARMSLTAEVGGILSLKYRMSGKISLSKNAG